MKNITRQINKATNPNFESLHGHNWVMFTNRTIFFNVKLSLKYEYEGIVWR